jgi:hypothetical protein
VPDGEGLPHHAAERSADDVGRRPTDSVDDGHRIVGHVVEPVRSRRRPNRDLEPAGNWPRSGSPSSRPCRDHLLRLRGAGYRLAGDPAVLASAFNALLEGSCAIWIGGSGEPIGRTLGDDEAIDTLTDLLHPGLAARDD